MEKKQHNSDEMNLLPLEPNRYRVQETIDAQNFERFQASLEKKRVEEKGKKEKRKKEKKAKSRKKKDQWQEKSYDVPKSASIPTICTDETSSTNPIGPLPPKFDEGDPPLVRDEWMLHPLPRLKKDENEIPSEEVKKLELFDGWNVMGENKTVPSSSPDYLVGDGGLSWRNKSVRSTTRKNWRDRGSTVNSNLETERAKPELSPNTQSNSEFIYKPRSDGRVGWKKDDRRNQNLGGPQREQGERENQGQNREQRGYHTHHQHQQFDRQGAGSSTRQQKEPQQQQTEPQRQKPERQEEEHSRRMDDETSLDLDIDPNEIAAAALKARLMGDTEEFEKLEKKLEALKKIQTGEGSGDRTFLPEQEISISILSKRRVGKENVGRPVTLILITRVMVREENIIRMTTLI
eukprot:TRINITY_DN10483_c0_g1_i21.p1 TRINITY_DN10483_c0_g1~~TRINITY_DN10483_c0_g1_i21.p1  ORF type:complete len:405 (-),score=108.54 TRINITY_DN10483_c0_g1_i21:1025-2239(-)